MDGVAEPVLDLRLVMGPVPAVDEAVDAVLDGILDVPVGDFGRAFVVPADGRAAFGPGLDHLPSIMRAFFPKRAVVHQVDVIRLRGARLGDVGGFGQIGRRLDFKRELLGACPCTF